MLLWKMGNGSDIIQSTCIRIHMYKGSGYKCDIGCVLSWLDVIHISCLPYKLCFSSLDFPTKKVWAVVAINFGLRRMV